MAGAAGGPGGSLGRVAAALRRLGGGSDDPGDRTAVRSGAATSSGGSGPPVPLPAGTGGRYARATESLRAAAKWLLAALAAVGGVLLAGLQLTKLGSFQSADWPRLTVAIAAAVTALAAVGYMIALTSRIFTDEWVTLADLDDEAFDRLLEDASPSRKTTRRVKLLGDLRARIDSDRQGLYAHLAKSVPDLYRELREANEAARAAPPEDLAQAITRVSLIRTVVNEVTDCANYHRTRLILRQLRPRLAAASAVTVAAVLVFAYAANPPDKPVNDKSPARRYSSSPSIATTEPDRSAEPDRMSCTITPDAATVS
jgi:hypothetical protein